ncbi:hypothetical protein [Castellaniella sp.]|uniref:hypothetical protein n=1 Tax=Castellaniella sp. TaxID=1955812 RepID=UPI002AFF533A|nr:hypothetical protein [Castellaniella sp.]
MTDTAQIDQIDDEVVQAAAHGLMAFQDDFRRSVSGLLVEHHVHPLIAAHMLTREALVLICCAMFEAEDSPSNDDVRTFWSTMIERVRSIELTDEALNESRDNIEKIIADQPTA